MKKVLYSIFLLLLVVPLAIYSLTRIVVLSVMLILSVVELPFEHYVYDCIDNELQSIFSKNYWTLSAFKKNRNKK